METNKILSANILDIIFDERNKDYGAYDLRKSYNSRVRTSLLITAVLPVIIIGMAFITYKADEKKERDFVIKDVIIETQHDIPKLIQPAPVLYPERKQIKTITDAPPIIVTDKLVPNPPPENKALLNVTIDTKTHEGATGDGSIVPPTESIYGSNVIEAPKLTGKENELPFFKVEIEAIFKGDWGGYIKKEIEKNLDELIEAGESGTCIVKFIVSKNGKVSDVEATTMKGTKLAEIAVNAIRKGPSWIPAQQNGRDVNAYRLQPITFKIQE